MAYTDEQRITDYRIAFGSDAGKRVLDDLCARCHMLESTLMPEPHITAFREGERNVILEILRILTLRPSDLRKKTEDVYDLFKGAEQ